MKRFLHDEVEEGDCYIINTNDMGGTTGEVPRLLLTNPSTSKRRLRIYKIKEGVTTSTGNCIFRYYKNPTVTSNGTPMTINNLLIKSDAPSSSMLAYVSPTISDN